MVIPRLLNRTKFTQIYSVEHELKKAAILRVFLGFFVLARYLEVFYSLSIYSPGVTFIQSILLLSIIVFFIFGLVTPVSTIALAIGVNWFDSIAGTGTLGTSILVQILMVMFLMNHGLYGSLDSLIMQSKNNFSKKIEYLYNLVGKPTNESIRIAYFLGFLYYAVLSILALGYHLMDTYWIQGLTLQAIVTNSYIFKYYEIFRNIEKFYPVVIFLFSAIGGVLQTVFQLLMVPLIFFSWGRMYVIAWGMIFFVISLIGIGLSYLPHIELVLWLLIFFSIKTTETQIVNIIYDDYCNLCTRAMVFFKAINFNGRYKFIALSKNKELYESHGFNGKEVQTYMAGWKNGKKYIGYELYIVMFKANVLLWLLLPLLYLGKIGNVGKSIYSYVAEYRYKFFGVCSTSSQDIIKKQYVIKALNENTLFLKLTHALFALVLVVFLAFRSPIGLNDLMSPKSFLRLFISIQPVFVAFGLQVPNVFNAPDLGMGDHWLVMLRQVGNEKYKLVPVVDYDGSRLNYEGVDILYFSNHNSDFLYFGTTLGYRRGMIGIADENLVKHHTIGKGYDVIKKRIRYDYGKKNLSGLVNYKIDVYKNSSSIVEQWKADVTRYDAKIIFTADFVYDGRELRKAFR